MNADNTIKTEMFHVTLDGLAISKLKSMYYSDEKGLTCNGDDISIYCETLTLNVSYWFDKHDMIHSWLSSIAARGCTKPWLLSVEGSGSDR